MDSLTILIIIVCILVYWRAEAAISAFYRVQAAETSVMFQIDEAKKEISEYVKAQERAIEGSITTSTRADINHIKEDMINWQDSQKEAIKKELTTLESSIKAEMSDINNSITSHSQHIKAVDERQDNIFENLNLEIIPLINSMQKRISDLEDQPQQQDTETGQMIELYPCTECPDREPFKSFEAFQGHCYAKGDPAHIALIEELRNPPQGTTNNKGL